MYYLSTKIRLTCDICLGGFELYSRWVPLIFVGFIQKQTFFPHANLDISKGTQQCRCSYFELSLGYLWFTC